MQPQVENTSLQLCGYGSKVHRIWFRSSVGLEQQPSKLWVLGSNPNGITFSFQINVRARRGLYESRDLFFYIFSVREVNGRIMDLTAVQRLFVRICRRLDIPDEQTAINLTLLPEEDLRKVIDYVLETLREDKEPTDIEILNLLTKLGVEQCRKARKV